jgi:hypothetical protein
VDPYDKPWAKPMLKTEKPLGSANPKDSLVSLRIRGKFLMYYVVSLHVCGWCYSSVLFTNMFC